MAKKVFFSFHYKPDNWRASQIRNIGVIEGNPAVSDNDWEAITKGGDDKIKAWIEEQLKYKACTIVLIGTNTAGRKWINYEIEKSWNGNKGVLGIYVHNLKDAAGNQSAKGKNSFDSISMKESTKKLSDYAHAYDPTGSTSKDVYDYISSHIETWVDQAIKDRG